MSNAQDISSEDFFAPDSAQATQETSAAPKEVEYIRFNKEVHKSVITSFLAGVFLHGELPEKVYEQLLTFIEKVTLEQDRLREEARLAEEKAKVPEWDALHCTIAENFEMVQGYRDGFDGKPKPEITTRAYDHGRKNGVNDKAGTSDIAQQQLAKRAINERVFDRRNHG